MKPWLSIAASSALLFACASTPTTPDWVNGKSAKYPDNVYLVGRGQADTQEDARNRARADLAKILEVGVSAKSTDVTTYTSEGGGKTESQVARNVTTRTDQIVRGIQIPEFWQDPQNKSTYALAVLSRSQASAGLRADIDRLDSATRGYIAQARSAPDLLAQVAAAAKAYDSQRERDAVQRTLQVVDITGQGVPPEQNSGQLGADLSALLKRVHMRPQAVPGSQDGLERLLSAALSQSGFVPEAGDDAPYVLLGSLQLDDLGVIQGWYWMRGTLEVQLSEKASGKVRGNKRWEIKTSSPQKATAQRRAMDEVDATLKRELKPAIIGFAVGS